MTSDNSKRLAKNTLYMYLRMGVSMIVTLFTSRIVLHQLGEVGYGLYNVVAGIIILFSFISNTLSSSYFRFISFAVGENDDEKIKNVFSTTQFINIIIIALVIILAETIGLWYVINILNIPSCHKGTTIFVYEISILTVCWNILAVPFSAMIIAYEKMKLYAYLTLFDVFFKLIIACLLTFVTYKLQFYALMLCLVSFLVLIIYYLYCRRLNLLQKLLFKPNGAIIKEIGYFSGWTFYSGVSNVISSQGLNLLLNYVYGLVINTAYGLSMQVQNAIRSFSLGFQIALNPQLIKTFSSGEMESHRKLIFRSCKISFYLLLLIAAPIFFNISSLLDVWLVKYPEATINFVKWILLTTILIMISNPFSVSVEASGRIKKMTLITGTLILSSLPLSWIFLKLCDNPDIPFIILFLLNFASLIVKILFCRKIASFNLRQLALMSFVPMSFVGIMAVLACWILQPESIQSFGKLIFTLCAQFCAIAILIYVLGLTRNERIWLRNLFLDRIKRK